MLRSKHLIVPVFAALALTCVYAAPTAENASPTATRDIILDSKQLESARKEPDSLLERPDSPDQQEPGDSPRDLRVPQSEGSLISAEGKSDLDADASGYYGHYTYYKPHWGGYYGGGWGGRGYGWGGGWGGRGHGWGNGWKSHYWY